MLFFIYHQDREGAHDLRLATRPAHLEYAAGFKVLMAGPTLTDDRSQMTGSVIIVDLPDAAAAEKFVANDPYTKAGLFKSSVIKPWRQTVPAT